MTKNLMKRRGWYARLSGHARHCESCRVFHPWTYARRGLRNLLHWRAS